MLLSPRAHQVIIGRTSSKMSMNAHPVDLITGELNLWVRKIRMAASESHSE